MSVLFLPPSAGAASVPDASETVSGKIRIATSAEATAGTNDLTAMTPAKTKSVVDAAVVGGVTYQGTFDASSPADLSNASKGDLYIISVAGTYQGQTWAVGDHLLINADMGGTLDPAKIDKVDNTDSVTSVAGRTGAVTLSTADISGLATVASTGAYSDLTGAPTLATVATTGAYSDLSGTPTLGTAAAEDVGTLAGNVVQLDGSARLPAVDGSQLTNLPNGTLFYNTNVTSIGPTLPQITDNRRQHYNVQLAGGMTIPSATSAAIGGVYSVYNSDGTSAQTVNCPSTLLLSGATVTSYTVEPYEARSFVWVGASSLQEITATRLGHFNGVSITSPSNGEALIYNSTSGDWENGTVSASVAALNDIGDVTITSAADGQFLKYDSGSSAWINGDSGLYDSVTYNTTATMTAPNEPKTLSVALNGTISTRALTLYTATTGTVGTIINISNYGSVDFTVSTQGAQNIHGVLGVVTSFTLSPNQTAILTQSQYNAFFLVAYEEQGLGSLADVNTSGAVATNVLKYDGADWVDGAVAYSEVTGTPTLGTAAALDVGTSAGNVVQLDGSARLPAVDGSQLTNLPSGGNLPTVTTQTGNYTIPSRSTGQLNLTVIVNNGATAVTIDLPSIASGDVGFTIDIKVLGTGVVTVDAGSNYIDDGSSTSVTISTQYDSRTFQAGSTTDWYII